MSKKTINFQALAWTPLVLASAISSLFVPNVYAADDEVKSLAPVVVTASRVEQPQTEALPHTTVITKEEISESGASDVLSLLHKEAGVEIAQSGGAGTQTSVFMRGTESGHTLFLIDGVPVEDASSTSGQAAFLEHILPEQIERIEIVRGNVSAIYGSRAIGGVIQIFTKRGSGSPSVHLSAESGARGTTNLTGGISGQSGKTRYALSLTHFETDGFSSINTADRLGMNPDKDGAENLSLTASVSHEWAKGNELGARIYAHDAKYDFDNEWGNPTQIDEGESKQKTFAVFSKNRISSSWLSTLTLSSTEIDRKTGSIGGTYYFFESDTRLLQWANEVMLSPNWVMTVGTDLAKEYSDKGKVSEKSRSNNSVYAGLNGSVDDHSFQLNLRYDEVGDSGSDTTYYLGYGYAFTPKWKAVASTSTAFLAPSLYQLYDGFSGNEALKAERSLTHEFGLQYATGQTIVRATLFESRTRNLIQWSGVYENTGKAKNQGFEVSASSQIVDVDVKASMTLQNPKNDYTGERLSRRAKTLASLDLSKQMGAWRVGGDINYVGDRKDGTYELSSYWLANLNANYKINKQWSAFGRVENLFDKDYQTVYGYNQTPFGVFVGLRWNQR